MVFGAAETYSKVTTDSNGRVTAETSASLTTNVTGTLQAAQFPALTGDITTSAGSLATSLKAVGTAGTYTKVTTDSNGRVSSGTTLSASDIPSLSSTYAALAGGHDTNRIKLKIDALAPRTQSPKHCSLRPHHLVLVPKTRYTVLELRMPSKMKSASFAAVPARRTPASFEYVHSHGAGRSVRLCVTRETLPSVRNAYEN